MNNDTTANAVNVGDVFVSSWGYEQTNTDYYQVVGLTAGNKSVKVRKISHNTKQTGMMCGESTPLLNNFIGDVQTKRLNGDGFRVNSFSYAFKTLPNKPHYCSWYH